MLNKCCLSRKKDDKPEVLFQLSEALAQKDPSNPDDSTAPRDHKFVLTGIGGQTLSVLSQTGNPGIKIDSV